MRASPSAFPRAIPRLLVSLSPFSDFASCRVARWTSGCRHPAEPGLLGWNCDMHVMVLNGCFACCFINWHARFLHTYTHTHTHAHAHAHALSIFQCRAPARERESNIVPLAPNQASAQRVANKQPCPRSLRSCFLQPQLTCCLYRYLFFLPTLSGRPTDLS